MRARSSSGKEASECIDWDIGWQCEKETSLMVMVSDGESVYIEVGVRGQRREGSR
jgi:hypothetical protein